MIMTYTTDIVVEAYRKHLRRSPDVDGFAYWVARVNELLTGGATPQDVENTLSAEFTGSAEYKAYTSK